MSEQQVISYADRQASLRVVDNFFKKEKQQKKAANMRFEKNKNKKKSKQSKQKNLRKQKKKGGARAS